MKFSQRALRFICHGSCLLGVVDVPERPLQRGLLILSSGQQYRVGPHRQFTLLARTLAPRGLPVMRFDCRGMGDSEGLPGRFDALDDDIHAAIKEFFRQVPEMSEVVLLGLDDAATAATLYAHTDARVTALIVLNPRLRPANGTGHGKEAAHARSGELGFWRRIAGGQRDLPMTPETARHHQRNDAHDAALPLEQRFMAGLHCFDGRTLAILSGADPYANSFAELLERDGYHARRVTIADADHHFASRSWREQVAETSANWIMSW